MLAFVADSTVTLRTPLVPPLVPRLLGGLLGALLCLVAGFPALAQPWVEKSASLVIDADRGTVLHADRAGELRHPASLTKMMTLYLAFEAIEEGRLSANQALPVSSYAASRPPSRLGLTTGSRIQARQAVLGLITKSANDASVVLAEALGGSEYNFARLMTARARAMGMEDTVFTNASGLPDREQVTTARDLAILAIRLQRDFPEHYQLFATESFAFRGRMHGNHNRLLANYDGTDGIKTGYIRDSGFNLVASARRDGRRLIGVVLGGDTGAERDQKMIALLDDAFVRIGVGEVRTASAQPLPSGALRIPSLVGTAQAAARAPGALARGVQSDIGDRAEATARGPQSWRVQLGAFSQRTAAVREAELGSDRFGGTAQVVPTTLRGRRLHRAVLTNLTASEAHAVCAERKRRRLDCTASGPQAATRSASIAPARPGAAAPQRRPAAATAKPAARNAAPAQRRPSAATPAASRPAVARPASSSQTPPKPAR